MTKTQLLTTRAPELLAEFMDQTMHILQHQGGLPAEQAAHLALSIVSCLAETHGGERVPKGNWNGRSPMWFQLAERDWNIYQEYKGNNWQEVCARHGISKPRLYQILAVIRKLIASERLSPAQQKRPAPGF